MVRKSKRRFVRKKYPEVNITVTRYIAHAASNIEVSLRLDHSIKDACGRAARTLVQSTLNKAADNDARALAGPLVPEIGGSVIAALDGDLMSFTAFLEGSSRGADGCWLENGCSLTASRANGSRGVLLRTPTFLSSIWDLPRWQLIEKVLLVAVLPDLALGETAT